VVTQVDAANSFKVEQVMRLVKYLYSIIVLFIARNASLGSADLK